MSLNELELITPATQHVHLDLGSEDIDRGYMVVAKCPNCGAPALTDTGWQQPMSPPNRAHVCLVCEKAYRINCEKGYPRMERK